MPQSIKLHSVRYKLFSELELKNAFERRCFDQAYKFRSPWFDDDTLTTRTGIIDTIRNSSLESWLSSPIAMADSIEQNLSTPGDKDEIQIHENDGNVSKHLKIVPQLGFWGQPATGRRGKRRRRISLLINGVNHHSTPMHLSLVERKIILMPLSGELVGFDTNQDDKLLKLIKIVEEHCLERKNKVVIFVGRHLTAIYLANTLEQAFEKKLNIGCTIELGESSPRLKDGQYRSEILKTFSPRSHGYDVDKEYDVLICTDADGVGVNLQDADTVVNYDPPEGADVLFQRAGRVLRMTADANRSVQFYTLTPSIIDDKSSQSSIQKDIQAVFERITQRHNKSKSILGSAIMSDVEYAEISLDGEIDVEQLTRDRDFLKTIGGLGAESMINHTSILEQYRSRAENLPEYLLSARSYSKTTPSIFVLIEFNKRYMPIVFDLKNKQIENLEDFYILDLISCTDLTPRAPAKPSTVEHLANAAVNSWCSLENISIDQVRKICALYLVPITESVNIKTLLKDQD